MNKKHSYDEKKSKKAILIIVIILAVGLAGRMIITKIRSNQAEGDNSSGEKVLTEEVANDGAESDENSEPERNEIKIEPLDEEDLSKDRGIDVQIEPIELPEQFYISEITDEIFERMKGKSFKDDCTLDRSELRYIHVLHKTLDGETLEGEMVVNCHIADDVLEIFRELYENDYPIERMRLVDEYDADDERSMSDNNSSSFNFRFISHTTKISKHGYGLAVDINPLYNPYIKTVDGKLSVEPANGVDYVDRDGDYPYKITHEDLAFKLFTEHGFSWGGDWENRKDYQHFEISQEQIDQWYPE